MRENVLFETGYWKVILEDNQYHLGRCVVDLKRDCGALSEEWAELHESIIQRIESLMKDVFSATMFNWACLMNNAYRKKPYSPHIHFFPRYEKSVELFGETFVDSESLVSIMIE